MATPWRLIARFPTETDVFFVKMHVEHGTLRCSCNEFAMAAVELQFTCRHTRFCHEQVIDDVGAVELNGVMPKEAKQSVRQTKWWIERHVREYWVDGPPESPPQPDGDSHHRGTE